MATTILPSLNVQALGGFSDVSSGHTFYTFINELQLRGIINGYPDGSLLSHKKLNNLVVGI